MPNPFSDSISGARDKSLVLRGFHLDPSGDFALRRGVMGEIVIYYLRDRERVGGVRRALD